MKFSIIVPVYNVEAYIKKCLQSIKNQTLADFECLIVNDGTKDNSITEAKKVIEGDDRFIILDKENGGLSDARNYGLERAKGEYVFFLDSDDYIDHTLLEKTYLKAKEHDSDICRFDLYYLYEDGSKKICKCGEKEIDSYSINKKIIFENHSANSKIYRLSFLKNHRFIKDMWYEDLATVPVLMANANNVSYVEEPLYNYLQRKGSISHSADPRIFDIYKAIDNIKKELKITSEDLFDYYYYDCMIMTTLRIRDIEDKNMRKEYYSSHIFRLNSDCPSWYELAKKKNPSFKQKIVFLLMKLQLIGLLDRIYR